MEKCDGYESSCKKFSGSDCSEYLSPMSKSLTHPYNGIFLSSTSYPKNTYVVAAKLCFYLFIYFPYIMMIFRTQYQRDYTQKQLPVCMQKLLECYKLLDSREFTTQGLSLCLRDHHDCFLIFVEEGTYSAKLVQIIYMFFSFGEQGRCVCVGTCVTEMQIK